MRVCQLPLLIYIFIYIYILMLVFVDGADRAMYIYIKHLKQIRQTGSPPDYCFTYLRVYVAVAVNVTVI